MNQTKEAKNKALVLEAFDALFNKRDYPTAERYWSPHYIQHSAHIAPGREGLFNLVKSAPPTLKYEPGVILAKGDFVIVHGRFSGNGRPVAWIAADILHYRWRSRRTLGCTPGRGRTCGLKKRPPDVWRPFLAVGQ
jgi:predicted SnoaL-like aldol condensation-catalyzing enzyme